MEHTIHVSQQEELNVDWKKYTQRYTLSAKWIIWNSILLQGLISDNLLAQNLNISNNYRSHFFIRLVCIPHVELRTV